MMTEEERMLYQKIRRHEERIYQLAKRIGAIEHIREEWVQFTNYLIELKDELKCIDDVLWEQRFIHIKEVNKIINQSAQTEEEP